MELKLKPNDPVQAKDFFEKKMKFTTGPDEVDYAFKNNMGFNLVDVRASGDYEKGHVKGAISLPEDDWHTFRGLKKDAINVLYCYSIVCHLGARAAVLFASAGYPVMEMDGGFESWKEHGLEIEVGKPKPHKDVAA